MKVIFPGSFDPPTLGHLALVERAAQLFEHVTVVVANNPDKNYWLKGNERLELFSSLVSPFKNVEVIADGGLVATLASRIGAQAIVKGLRSEADYRTEQVMSEANAVLGAGLESIFLMSRGNLQGVSSSLVRQIHQLGGDVSSFVPKIVSDWLKSREK
jgi:pantetheine-phosphate adenylyltransferase